MKNRQSLDLDYSNQNELSYMLGDSLNCYGCQFVFDSKNCSNCYFISDCTGCTECILCTNLANKSYFINNKQYSKEEYAEKKKELINGGFSRQRENYLQFLKMLKKRIVKYAHAVSCENCSGDYLKNCKNCHGCFDAAESQDLTDVIFANACKDCFNCSLLGDESELCYNTVSTFSAYNARYSFFTLFSSNIEYCDFVLNSQNLFGCTCLKRNKYCILNRQYAPEDYEKLRKKIVEHMKKTGEWEKIFPKTMSCFGYNETTAQEYYPLTREKALKQGFKWQDENTRTPAKQTYDVPDNILDVPDSITAEILTCSESSCGKNFKIIAPELKFYRSQQIPVPRSCPDCRHKERQAIRNPRRLWNRKCAKCGLDLKSSYAPDRPETVYCETCYLKEVY